MYTFQLLNMVTQLPCLEPLLSYRTNVLYPWDSNLPSLCPFLTKTGKLRALHGHLTASGWFFFGVFLMMAKGKDTDWWTGRKYTQYIWQQLSISTIKRTCAQRQGKEQRPRTAGHGKRTGSAQSTLWEGGWAPERRCSRRSGQGAQPVCPIGSLSCGDSVQYRRKHKRVQTQA